MSDELAGKKEIDTAAGGLVGLAIQGFSPDDFMRHLGIDPEAVRDRAREAAEEEFMVLPGMPTGIDATGRLRKLGLSANQRKVVKESLEETWITALQIGAVLMRAQQTKQEGDGSHD